MDYAIYFLGTHNQHITDLANGNHVRRFSTLEDLYQSISTLQMHVPVCICCSNTTEVLGRIQPLRNIACIYVCKQHRFPNEDNSWSIDYPNVREISSNEPSAWRLEAHTAAFHANANHGFEDIARYIQQIIRQLLEQGIYPNQGPIQEGGHTNSSSGFDSDGHGPSAQPRK